MSKLKVSWSQLSILRHPVSVSFVSWVIETCPEILYDHELLSLQEAVHMALKDTKLINPAPVTSSSELKRDKRSTNHDDDTFVVPNSISDLKVFTDYEYFGKNLIDKLDLAFQLVNTKEEADFLFLAHNIRDFYSIPSTQRVNQFPYEGGFVCKV